MFRGGPGYRTREGGRRFQCLCQRHVDVFEGGSGGDAFDAAAGLDEVVSGTAGLFAAESVGKNEWFGELTGAHQKTGAVDDPLAFRIHGAFFHPSAGLVRFRLSILGWGNLVAARSEMLASSGATVLAPRERVNTIRIVQRWNFRSRMGRDESGSSMGRG